MMLHTKKQNYTVSQIYTIWNGEKSEEDLSRNGVLLFQG